MRTFPCLPLALLLATGSLVPTARSESASEQPITVAIFDFTLNVGRVLPKDVTSLVTADLSADPRLSLVERAQLTKALREQALGLRATLILALRRKLAN